MFGGRRRTVRGSLLVRSVADDLLEPVRLWSIRAAESKERKKAAAVAEANARLRHSTLTAMTRGPCWTGDFSCDGARCRPRRAYLGSWNSSGSLHQSSRQS